HKQGKAGTWEGATTAALHPAVKPSPLYLRNNERRSTSVPLGCSCGYLRSLAAKRRSTSSSTKVWLPFSPASRSWAKLPARNCSPILKWQPGWPTSRNILTQRNWSISVEMQRRNRLAAVGRCVFAHLPLRLDVPLGSESSQRVS